MRDDFPTFDLPIKAYSAFTGGGSLEIWVLLQMNSAVFTIMLQRYGLINIVELLDCYIVRRARLIAHDIALDFYAEFYPG
jgi:hypothetical protein